jgi:hypothetical protein
MNWKNANRDPLPTHEQNVLVAIDGVYYITIFDLNHNVFRLAEDLKSCFGIRDEEPIYWLEIDSPS